MPDPEVMRIVERARRVAPAIPDKPKRLPLKQLPLWPEAQRAAPSAVLRSSLFRVTKTGIGSFNDAKIASWPDVTISYTGLELTQPDLDVWLEALHMAKEQLGHKVVFTARGLLRAIGRRGGGRTDTRWLEKVFRKLTANAVVIRSSDGGKVYGAGLIHKYMMEGDACYLEINPDLARLFEDENYTRLDWVTRRELKGNLTKWLHAYVCSHRATPKRPSKLGLEKLRVLCGSECKTLRNFRLDVRKSVKQLQDKGVVDEWSVDDDVLSFVRPPKQRGRKPKQLAAASIIA